MKVGILRGGQLARMLAEAGHPMGLSFLVVDPKPGASASQVAEQLVADYDSEPARDALADCDAVTCDFENVPAAALEALAERVPVRPSAAALAAAQDRFVEKSRFQSLDMATPAFAAVDRRPDLLAAIDRIGLPAVLKTRTMGYDGKGQVVLRDREDLEAAWQRLSGRPLILEQWVAFDHECSITVVRGADGNKRFYPLSRTWHADGILRLAVAPCPNADRLQAEAERMAGRLADDLDYVGCLTLELFASGNELRANEFAPRAHNSAHWTIEGARCSQFENHLRAVCGWPLGDPAARSGISVLFNFIGELPEAASWLAVDGLAWHDYGKTARPGRKVGHATLVAPDREALDAARAGLEDLLPSDLRGALDGILPRRA